MRMTWPLTLVVGRLAALAVPDVGAPPGTQQYRLEEVGEVSDPGTDEHTGAQPVWHKRGWTAAYVTHDETGEASEMVSGSAVVVASWDVDMANWRGNLWGTADWASDVYDDSGWKTTWTAEWTGTFKWSGRGAGDGYGQFDGMKMRYEVENVPPTSESDPPRDIVTGFVFTPGQQ